jgi:F-type H+-transporting ATPase subunit beta
MITTVSEATLSSGSISNTGAGPRQTLRELRNSRERGEAAVASAALVGKIVSVQGAVVDVRFEASSLPAINTALVVDWDRPEALFLEVHSHVDTFTVRTIALQATPGLKRGVAVRSTGGPVSKRVYDLLSSKARKARATI